MALREIRVDRPNQPPIATAIVDLFKLGPGPSSSHTIGPMLAANDFSRRIKALPPEVLKKASSLKVELYGSLSATGKGHGTSPAVMAGLMGFAPGDCPAGILARLEAEPTLRHNLNFGAITLSLGLEDIVNAAVAHNFPYSNTITMSLLDERGASLENMEYYSVGGGFIQWKGWKPPERGKPRHPYGSMRELRDLLKETGLVMHELIIENEMAITGASRPAVYDYLQKVMEAMLDSVKRGLETSGMLPGALGAHRKAISILESAEKLPLPYAADRFLARLNAYAFAASEENAGGGVIVTAPTCGAAGVMPALLYSMRHDLNIGDRAIREGVLASAAIAFLAKHNAAIAGAEVGCQGEVGVASAMGAAMLAHSRGYSVEVVEHAAEIALEHHLGLTCDPVGGYVQIPCIERNAVGAVKAYNAAMLAACEKAGQHMVTLDAVIMAMGETGREMNAKFKETSAGGLAVCLVDC